MNGRRAVIGAATAVLALLALAAMHGLPSMGMTMPAAAGHDLATHSSHAADATAPLGAATDHDAGGVPLHGHSLVHLCFAVLVAALTFALGRRMRPRALTLAPQLREVVQRSLFSLDIGPPSRVALCVVRC